MLRWMCKSKIHGAVVTEKNVNYSGSIKIDAKLLKSADIVPNEMVMVINLNNGERFETYAISGEEGSGVIGLQGGAALLGNVGDKLIIISSCFIDNKEVKKHKPVFLFVDEKNRIIEKK